MSAQPKRTVLIWVTGEPSENGLVVTDAVSEERVTAPAAGEQFDLPPRNGKARSVTAIQCPLVRVEEKKGKQLAVVRVGSKEVRVRVLAKWQLDETRPAAQATPEPVAEPAGA